MRTVSFGATLLLAALCNSAAFAATLHPGDKIDVFVYNHPELSGTRTLDASGSVSLPLAGTVRANGLGTGALANLVRARLAPYVRHAAVDVRLDEQSASVFVDGGPVGVLKYQPGETLTNVVDQLAVSAPQPVADVRDGATAHDSLNPPPLDLANGPQDFRSVRLDRDGNVSAPYDVLALRAAGDQGPALLPGDTIMIGHKPVAVSVMGDVERPGTAYLDPNEPLQQAITQAGGITATGSQDGIILRRDGTTQSITAGAPQFAQPAQNGDQLVVHRAPRVDVIGEVQKPGETYLRGDSTLVSAIYYAGGPAEYANLKNVVLVHDGVRKSYNVAGLQKGGTADNPQVADGDVVLVSKGSTFRVNDIWEALGALGLFGFHI